MHRPNSARFLCTTAAVALLAIIAGCGEAPAPAVQEAAASNGLVNQYCPIMGGEATTEVMVEWNGKKVGFCCPPCIEEWEELSETEKEQALASAKEKHHGDDAGHQHGGSTSPGTAEQPAAPTPES